jgi:hypothetical protein
LVSRLSTDATGTSRRAPAGLDLGERGAVILVVANGPDVHVIFHDASASMDARMAARVQ